MISVVIPPKAAAPGLIDNFNRADGSAESSPWLRRMSWGSESFVISSNTLKRNSGGANDISDGTDGMIFTTVATSSDDQWAEVDVTTLGGAPGPGVILGADVAGTSTALWAEIYTTGWRIFTAVPTSGSKSILASGSGTFTAGSRLRLVKTGSVARLYYGGSYLGGYDADTTNTPLPSGRYTGVRPGSASSAVDNWEAGDLVARSAGMQKSGTQTPGTTSWFQVTGWTTRAGHTNGPSSDSLVSTTTGVVVIRAQVDMGTGATVKNVRVKKNGTVAYETTLSSISTTPVSLNVHANAVAGDVFTVEAICATAPTVVAATTYATLRAEDFVFFTTHSDNFNRADSGSLGGVWEAASSLATPDISSNQAIGSGAVNSRSGYIASAQATRPGTWVKSTIQGIGSNHVGLLYGVENDSAKTCAYAALINSTTLELGQNTSTSSSNSGVNKSTVTVSTVSTSTEILAMHTSATTVDIFLNRVYVTTHAHLGVGIYNGLFVGATTDIVDDWSQGTWA
jgi:uncharacterized membrane protein